MMRVTPARKRRLPMARRDLSKKRRIPRRVKPKPKEVKPIPILRRSFRASGIIMIGRGEFVFCRNGSNGLGRDVVVQVDVVIKTFREGDG